VPDLTQNDADSPTPISRPRRRRSAGRDAGPPLDLPPEPASTEPEPVAEPVAEPEPAPEPARPRRRRARAAVAFGVGEPVDAGLADAPPAVAEAPPAPARRRRGTPPPLMFQAPAPDPDDEQPAAPARRRRAAGRPAAAPVALVGEDGAPAAVPDPDASLVEDLAGDLSDDLVEDPLPGIVNEDVEVEDIEDIEDIETEDTEDGLAQPRRRRRGRRGRGRARSDTAEDPDTADAPDPDPDPGGEGDEGAPDGDEPEDEVPASTSRRRRSRGGRSGARAPAQGDPELDAAVDADTDAGPADEGPDGEDDEAHGTTRRRRRRRRRTGGDAGALADVPDDPPNTVVHTREARRGARDGVRGVSGSTRLEAKRLRRRDGRGEARRRPPVLTESEFLARRESVERRMVVRRTGDRTQVAMLEDGVLVEHYVTKSSATSYAGNIYLGKVQNVLASMEAAFVDIGKGRNAVLYAGEVNVDGEGGGQLRIEQVLKPGQAVLVQVTKDPVGHKGARLTSQVSLPGRFLVYVPEGPMTGISRKLPDTERSRLKAILRKIVPEDAGVIIRTAAEGASEEDLTLDVARLQQQWTEIAARAVASQSKAPALLHGEPDLVIKTVRDLFNSDIAELVVQGEPVYREIAEYVGAVAPDLLPRVRLWEEPRDVFAGYRVDEGLAKALERKVHLPSGGSLVIDRTEALTAIDVNTGRFTGSGGNLEETVTRNNLEAAEEVVRQLRLRDIGGMVVVDFIDMVLESNRDLVLRRLVECLGRDRTKHQVSEVTSLGLVQLTRKRVGQGLLESFSEPCPTCGGRGVLLHPEGFDPEARPALPPPLPRPVPTPAAVAAVVSANGGAHVPLAGADEPGVEEADAADSAVPDDAAVAAVEPEPEAAAPARPRRGRRSASRDPQPAAPAEAEPATP